MQTLPQNVPDLSGADARAIAVIPWDLTPGAEVRFGKALADLSLDQVQFPLGRPARPGLARVGDLAPGDQLIVWARKKLHQLGHIRRGTRADLSIMLQEPRAVSGQYYWIFRHLAWRVRYLLMHDLEGFGPSDKLVFLPFGTSGILDWNELEVEKTEEVSLIASNRNNQPGHQLRHVIAAEKDSLRPDMKLLGRRYAPFVDKHDALAPYRFSVVIENSQQKNYFSEKLIDAILCRTVPIYWGCPNIGDFFDTDAFIVCETADEIRDALRNLSPELYAEKLSKLETQLERAAWYANIEKRAALALYERLEQETRQHP